MNYYRIELSSNGMLPSYPKCVWMDYMKIRDWKNLYIASKASSEAFDDVLTSVLDGIIDWEKTGFIKTSDKLTLPDRQKLFFWQRINCKGPEVSLLFKCDNPECDQLNEVKIDLTTVNEEKIKQKVKLESININGEKYKLKVPVREDLVKLNRLLKEYKYAAFKKINEYLYIEEINNLEVEMTRIVDNTNRLILEKMKQMKTGEVDELKKNSISRREEIKIKIDNLKNKANENLKDINDILEKYYLKKFSTVEDIKGLSDLDFDDSYTNYLVSLIIVIEGFPEDNIVKFMLDLPSNILKDLESHIKMIYHGLDKAVKTTCIFCGENIFRKLDLSPDFFLT